MRLGPLVALLAGLLGAACNQQTPGDKLCPNPVKPCSCDSTSNGGAVVVRWRISDVSISQLLSRGTCCCIPDATPPSELADKQCSNHGSSCPTSPAWLVRNVQLQVTPVGGGDACVISAPCSDGELTTPYCLTPGPYDLQLTADVDVYDASCQQFVCGQRRTVSPPTIRRTIVAGQATNLDGVVLGVNAPPLEAPSSIDGGSGGICN
jgi:hypothetical protein